MKDLLLHWCPKLQGILSLTLAGVWATSWSSGNASSNKQIRLNFSIINLVSFDFRLSLYVLFIMAIRKLSYRNPRKLALANSTRSSMSIWHTIRRFVVITHAICTELIKKSCCKSTNIFSFGTWGGYERLFDKRRQQAHLQRSAGIFESSTSRH